MSELRWILLLLGILMIGLIYLFSRRKSTIDEFSMDAANTRIPPQLDDESSQTETQGHQKSASEELTQSVVTEDSRDGAGTASALGGRSTDSGEPHLSSGGGVDSGVADKVVALHLVPNANQTFKGNEFVDALHAEGLKFGRFDIFHRFVESNSITENTPSIFSVANIIKPGTLSLHDLEKQELKGASMFLVLPGPEDPVAAFADMVATGRRLAATLNGQLLDGHGTKLSRQRASHLREDIINFQHGLTSADINA